MNEEEKIKGIRFSREEIEETKNYMKKERISNFSQAIRILRKKGLITHVEIEKIKKESDQEIKKWKEAVEMLRAGQSPKDIAPFSDEACEYLDYDEFGKAFCRNRSAPIKTNDLTPRACMICGKLRKDIDKSIRGTKRATSKIDKKKAKKIYCYGLYRELTLDFVNSHQAMCKTCEHRSPRKWAKCMRERVIIQ